MDGPLGIKFWAQFFEHTKPRYEVFRFISFDPKRGLYNFQSVKQPKLFVVKSFADLNVNGFRPYLLNCEKLLEELDDGPAAV